MAESTTINGSLKYLVAVVVMVLIGIISVLAVEILRPTADNTLFITTIVGFIAPTLMALLAFLKAQEARLAAQETRRAVDGRMDELLRLTREKAHAEGKSEEKVERAERMAGDKGT